MWQGSGRRRMCSGEMVSLVVKILRGSLLVVGVVAAQNATLTVTSPTSEDKIAIGEDFVVEFETEGDVSGPYLVDLYKAGGQLVYGARSQPMWTFCDTEGCETEDNSIPITISQGILAASNYTIRVKGAGDSGAEGYSDHFEILATTDSGVVAEESDVTGAGTVGHMNALMFVVAIVCGTAVCVAIIVAIYVTWHRRSQKYQTARALAANGLRGDVETGGGGGGGGGDRSRTTTARIIPPVAVSTSRRSMDKIGRSRSSSSAHPFSSETSAYMSSSENRGRSRTPSRVRDDGSMDRDSGRRMISRTPTRSWRGQEDDGPRMYPTTPQERGETHSGTRMYTPRRDDMDPPGSRESNGPRMFSSSPGLSARSAQDNVSISTFSSAPGANWEEPKGSRRMYSSTPSGSAQYEERARIISRSLSTGRERTPYGYHREDRYGDDTIPAVPKPHRRASSRSPSTVYPRSRSMDRHSRRPPTTQTLEQWQRDVERRREARGLRPRSPERWIEGELTSMPRSKSAHVFTRRERGDGPYSGAPAYDDYSRTFEDDPQRHGANMETRAPLGSSTRNRGYRSGLADFAGDQERDASRYHEVSWEEMRYKHIQQQQQQQQQQTKVKRDHAHSSQTGFDPDDSQGRMEDPHLEADTHALTKIYPKSGPVQPFLSDASSVGTLSVHSSGSHVHAPPPETYRVPPNVSNPSPATAAPRDVLGGEGGVLLGSGGLSANSDSKLIIHSQSSGSTGARALSARAAAREAQLSAERALAAAAAASRAADAAAQSATEAEAEADAERGAIIVKDSSKCAPTSVSALSSVGRSSVSSLTWSSTTASTKAVAGGSKGTRRGLATPRVGRPLSFSFMRSGVGATGSDGVDQGHDVNGNPNGKRAQPKKVEIEVKVKAKTKTKTKPGISVEPSKAPATVESEREDELTGTDETLSELANVNGGRERSGSQGSGVRGGDTAGGASEEETLPRSSKTPVTLALAEVVNGGGNDSNAPFRRHSFDVVSERTTTEHLPFNASTSPAARTSFPVLPVAQNEANDAKPDVVTRQPSKTAGIDDSTVPNPTSEKTILSTTLATAQSSGSS